MGKKDDVIVIWSIIKRSPDIVGLQRSMGFSILYVYKIFYKSTIDLSLIFYRFGGLLCQRSINKRISFDNLLMIPLIFVLTEIYDFSQFLLKCSVYQLFRDICNPNGIVRMASAVNH